jgi:hypothetical protein
MKNFYEVTPDGALHIFINTKGGVVSVQLDYTDLPIAERADRWGIFKDKQGRKLARSGKASDQVFLHKQLVDVPPGSRLEWINGDTLDCRRANLQLVDREGNVTPLVHRVPTVGLTCYDEPKTSDVPGVKFHKASQRWTVRIWYEGTRYSLGYFKEKADAEAQAAILRKEGPHSPNLKRNQRKGK